MAKFFLSARYRPNIWPFWVLAVIEFCLTVALLTFVGVAAPNLYRQKLQADGAANGFNSSPTAALYAAANYRPYKIPMVWSQFLTNYNLVIVVLSMFLLLAKSTLYILHVLPPVLNLILHLPLIAVYATGTYYQSSSDLSDPRKPQHGAPWYITKSCDVAHFRSNVGYCRQAKATFACTVSMLGIFVLYAGFALFSCFPSKEQRAEYEEKQRLKREKYGFLDESPQRGNDDSDGALEPPNTAGLANPMTPRTLAFNKLGGTKNAPLKINREKDGSSNNSNKGKEKEKRTSTGKFSLRSPGFPRTPGLTSKSVSEVGQTEIVMEGNNDDDNNNNNRDGAGSRNQMYFPPPPKQSTRK